MIAMSFQGMLMAVTPKVFVPDNGRNKGVEQKSTQLKFDVAGNELLMKAPGHIAVDPANMRREMQWELGVEPSTYQGVTKFTVLKIEGSKIKGG